jgi:catechol 2,3-dioxygenase-like lactoylglutathione lyase family enzyme
VSGIHHVAAVTDDPDAVAWVLREVLGCGSVSPVRADGAAASALLGWPDSPGVDGFITSPGRGGMIEVIPIPEQLRDTVSPGVALLSYAVRDIEDRIALCRSKGIEVSDPVRVTNETMDATLARFVVGGIPFELAQFHG